MSNNIIRQTARIEETRMNREKRETHEKVLFPEEFFGLLVNFGAHPKAAIIRIANTNFRDFRAFRGKNSQK
jgi:hypothetical protein